jgi:hypothetical protein
LFPAFDECPRDQQIRHYIVVGPYFDRIGRGEWLASKLVNRPMGA